VQIIKDCSLEVSCAAKPNKEACEKNAGAQKCLWNAVQSICYSAEATASQQGKAGGGCKKGQNGELVCDDGSKCIRISSSESKCSTGQPCQACLEDGDCRPADGRPGKCEANTCLIPDPSGTGYKKCGNGSCEKGSDCDTGHCDIKSKTCKPLGQGVDCAGTGQAACGADQAYQCVEFKSFYKGENNVNWIKNVCCLDGKTEGCLGCAADSGCLEAMFCLDTVRYAGFKKLNPNLEAGLEGKCINDLGSGLPCNDHAMCKSGSCVNDLCQ
jgi:hypothetical protein